MLVDRDRRLVSMRDCPDDVLRPPRRVAAEEYAGARRLHGDTVDDGHSMFVEVDTDVALDPRERILLADRENHVVTRNHDGVDHLTLLLSILLEPAQPVQLETDEFSFLENEALRRVVLDDLDAFLFGILELPRRRLEVRARTSSDDFDVRSTKTARRAAAVHRRIADADDQHTLADARDMTEVCRRKPLDADVDVC